MWNILWAVAGFALTIPFLQSFLKAKWDPRGKHCYITGGSSGLGLSLAILLARKGAHISIVARNKEKLQAAVDEIKKARLNESQVVACHSYSLFEEASSTEALEAACKSHGGRSPDVVFLCAGASNPRFFVEQDEKSLKKGMDNGYWVQALSALAATKRMVKEGSKGKIIFVSSVLGYFSIVGYSSYSPAKHALRGLAETLRSELILYGISVHCYFPGTIYSPGYAEENKTKPKITLKIEETDEGLTPEKCAEKLLQGVVNGDFHISSDLLSNIFRSSTRGATPFNNFVLDGVYSLFGLIGLPIWRQSVDSCIKAHRSEHNGYLEKLGFLSH